MFLLTWKTLNLIFLVWIWYIGCLLFVVLEDLSPFYELIPVYLILCSSVDFIVDEKIKQEIQGFWRRVYENKTPMCKHQRGCIYNVVQGMIKSAFLGLGAKFIINFLLGLLRPKTLVSNLFGFRNLLDTGRFTLFVVLFNISYKIALCSLRRATKNEKISSIVAGSKFYLLLYPLLYHFN